MAINRNIINFDPTRRSSAATQSVTLPQLVISAQRTAKHHLRQLLPDFFARIDDSLFDLADKADNNQQQTLYFDAMRDVRLQKDLMQKTYFEALSRGFEAALSASTQSSKNTPTLDQAGLLDDEQLEESLAISNMVGNAETRAKEALFGITARLDFLMEDIEITKDNNPLHPEVLFQAFVPAVRCMNADIKIRLVIYKLFDKFVAQKVAPIYDTINADLIAAGVLPRIKSTIRKSESAPVSHAADSTGYGTANSSDAEISPQSDSAFVDSAQPESMFSSLQQLLSMSRAASVASTMNGAETGGLSGPVHGNIGDVVPTGSTINGVANAAVYYAPQQVLTALSQLQNTDDALLSQSPQQDQSSANFIKTTLLQTIGQTMGQTSDQQQGGHKQIAQVDTDAIDIVSMLFDFILDDPSLADNIKAQIARLQIPLLKVAILDKDFFTKKAHPARQLLNELAFASSGLETIAPEEDAVFQMISYVVDSILAEFEENTEIFSTLHSEFVAFIEKERESNKLAGEMLENAKQRVASEIQRRVIDNRVPPLVSTLLIDAWKDVLTHLYLRDGDQGTAWNTALQVADDLIWSVQPKLAVSERQRLIKIIPRILNGLRDGLTLVQFDPKATEQLFAGLEVLHLASLRGGMSAETPNKQTNAATPVSLSDDDFGIDISTLPEAGAHETGKDSIIEEIILASTRPPPWENDELNASPYAEEIKEMALGTWVEFSDAETGHCRRGKLAWKCDFTGEYTFVDRAYQVVADLSNRKLIEKFESKHARFVDDVPLFDRALDAVINGIKHALDHKNTSTEAVTH